MNSKNIFIALLIGLNLFSLYNLNKCTVGQKLSFNKEIVPTRFVQPQLAADTKTFSIHVVIPYRSCSQCLHIEFPLIDKLAEKHGNRMNIVVLGPNDQVVREHGGFFPAKVIPTPRELFDKDIVINNPMLIVTDKGGNIVFFHKAVVGEYATSMKAYGLVESLLSASM